MFKMEIDAVKKTFTITASGFFSMQEGMQFMSDYNSKTKQFNPQQFTLIVDAKGVKASAVDVSEQLKNMMLLYMSVPFKKRISIKQDSAVAASQINRLSQEIPGFDTMIFVDSIEDAQKLI